MKQIYLTIFLIVMTIADTANGEFNKISEVVDALKKILETETFLFRKLRNQVAEHQQQLSTYSNSENNLRELAEVSKIINHQLSDTVNMFHLLKRFKYFLKSDKDPLSNIDNINGLKNVTTSEDMYPHVETFDDSKSAIFDPFTQMLCNGEVSIKPDISKNLKCRYTDKGNLFLKIAPLKEEEAYLQPDIMIYHNVLNDEEIEMLKNVSYPLLRDSLVRAVGKGVRQTRVRVSKNVWLGEDDHEYVKNVNRRVELVTNLAINTAEELQVTYYQKNGYFNVHYDFEQTKINPFKHLGVGNRIATLMFYLNDVEEGGRTIFPMVHLSLTPEKGSAVFWYNLFPNGEFDFYTIHAGCPVTAGTKWVANKWLHEFGQEFRRPCTLINYKWNADGTLSTN